MTAPSLPFLLYEIQHQTLTIWLSVFGFDPITNVAYGLLCLLTSIILFSLQNYRVYMCTQHVLYWVGTWPKGEHGDHQRDAQEHGGWPGLPRMRE